MASTSARALESEGAGVDISEHMGEKPAGHTGPEGGEEKGHDLGVPGVHGHGVGGDLVVPHGVQGLAQGGAHEVVDDPHAEHGPDEDRGQVRVGRFAAQAAGAAHDLQVLDEALHDEGEGKGDDGQVVPSGLEGRNGHDQGAQGGYEAPDHQPQREAERVPGRGEKRPIR